MVLSPGLAACSSHKRDSKGSNFPFVHVKPTSLETEDGLIVVISWTCTPLSILFLPNKIEGLNVLSSCWQATQNCVLLITSFCNVSLLTRIVDPAASSSVWVWQLDDPLLSPKQSLHFIANLFGFPSYIIKSLSTLGCSFEMPKQLLDPGVIYSLLAILHFLHKDINFFLEKTNK